MESLFENKTHIKRGAGGRTWGRKNAKTTFAGIQASAIEMLTHMEPLTLFEDRQKLARIKREVGELRAE